MRRPNGRHGIVTKTWECPECGTLNYYREQRGIRRFKPKPRKCSECGYIRC